MQVRQHSPNSSRLRQQIMIRSTLSSVSTMKRITQVLRQQLTIRAQHLSQPPQQQRQQQPQQLLPLREDPAELPVPDLRAADPVHQVPPRSPQLLLQAWVAAAEVPAAESVSRSSTATDICSLHLLQYVS